jgi:hypothetical protein
MPAVDGDSGLCFIPSAASGFLESLRQEGPSLDPHATDAARAEAVARRPAPAG